MYSPTIMSLLNSKSYVSINHQSLFSTHFKYIPQFWSSVAGDNIFISLQQNIPWTVYNWIGLNTSRPSQKAYFYTERDRKVKPIAELEQISNYLETRLLNISVTSIWVNLFEHGRHYIDWHQDRMDKHLFVASFGSSRRIIYRSKKEKKFTKYLTINHSDLYYVSPIYDYKHEHCVPIDTNETIPRISLAIFCSNNK